jgi:hypothetical protein
LPTIALYPPCRAAEFAKAESKDASIHVLFDNTAYAIDSGLISGLKLRKIYRFNQRSGLSAWFTNALIAESFDLKD